MPKMNFLIRIEKLPEKKVYIITVDEDEVFPSFQQKVAKATGVPVDHQKFQGITLPPGDAMRRVCTLFYELPHFVGQIESGKSRQ